MAKKEMLDKLEMPSRAAQEDPMLELGDEMAMDEEMGAEMEESPLAALSDEELIAEMKKRGLKMDEAEEMAGEGEEDMFAEGESSEESLEA
jgi:hypothetical protein